MEQKLGSYCLWWTLVLCLFLSPDEKGEIWKGDAFVASLTVDQTVNFFLVTSEEWTSGKKNSARPRMTRDLIPTFYLSPPLHPQKRLLFSSKTWDFF